MTRERVLESSTFTCSFSFDGQLPVFRGHFPKEPLVPAFLQLSTIRGYVSQHVTSAPDRILLRNVKFLKPLLPNEQVTLCLTQGLKANSLRFEVTRSGEQITHGELVIG